MAEVQEQEQFNNKKIEDPAKDADWMKVLFYTYLQILIIYGISLIFTEAFFSTVLYSAFLVLFGVLAVTAGAHRLWAHKSYTATTTLKMFLMVWQTLVGQGSIYNWVLYHRLHHAHYGTKKDPFNPNKGFLYAHLLCLVQKPPSNREELLKEIDMSDLENDSIIMFQKKYYWLLYLLVTYISIYIPIRYWKESLHCAMFVSGWLRYGITLHFVWLISSASTIFGLNKGEKYPSDTNLVFLWYKTYWLQYHYLAPWDFQTGEYGKYGSDFTTVFLRVCAAFEQATNLRTTDCALMESALHMTVEKKIPLAECLLICESNENLTPRLKLKKHVISN